MDVSHQYEDLIQIFNQLFQDSEKTILVRGDDEPVYLPAPMTGNYHQIIFAHGYYASAMHEIAHWCVAGEKRRLLEDYGYWYEPDGRTEQQQRLFETVEVIPQAIETCLCLAAGFKFRVSVDNLNGSPGDSSGFARNVALKAEEYLAQGLPDRAQLLFDTLVDYYKTGVFTAKSVVNEVAPSQTVTCEGLSEEVVA